jgi:two-component system OmpR family response regulator
VGFEHQETNSTWEEPGSNPPGRSQSGRRGTNAALPGDVQVFSRFLPGWGAELVGDAYGPEVELLVTEQSQGQRILVVDDEEYVRELLTTALRFMGFAVDEAASGLDAIAKAGTFLPDLILLDVMMPTIDGFEVCRRLRSDGDETPVIFLTAKDDDDVKLTGFAKGGDDFITKPFRLEEVIARIRAVLKRTGRGSTVTTHHRYQDLELDEDTHRVWRNGRQVDLSPTEFRVLRYLLLNPERVLSKAQILDHVWQYDFGGDAAVIENYISYLRKKIDNVEPKLIHTIRGVGYSLRVDGR